MATTVALVAVLALGTLCSSFTLVAPPSRAVRRPVGPLHVGPEIGLFEPLAAGTISLASAAAGAWSQRKLNDMAIAELARSHLEEMTALKSDYDELKLVIDRLEEQIFQMDAQYEDASRKERRRYDNMLRDEVKALETKMRADQKRALATREEVVKMKMAQGLAEDKRALEASRAEMKREAAAERLAMTATTSTLKDALRRAEDEVKRRNELRANPPSFWESIFPPKE